MGSPHKKRHVGRIIVFVIIFRYLDREIFAHIPFVFSIQGYTVVFRVSHNENAATAVCHGKEKSCFLRFRQHSQFLTVVNIFNRNLCMSGMRCQEHIIKSSHQRNLTIQYLMPKKAEHFLIQRSLFQSVKMIKTGLCRPAQENSRGYMFCSPVHDLCKLLPVIHLLEFHLLYRCSGNDHSIVFITFKFRKSLVKFIQMTHRSILGLMALHCHKSHIYLQRSVGKGTQKLQFCLLLQRHQIQDQDLNRTDILMGCTGFIHHKYIFFFQNFFYGQIALYLNRHSFSPFSLLFSSYLPGLLSCKFQEIFF